MAGSVICRQEGDARFMGPPLQMKDKLTKKISTVTVLEFLYDFTDYDDSQTIRRNKAYTFYSIISSPRCAVHRVCFRNAFNMHLKCIPIHLSSALRDLYSFQQYELVRKKNINKQNTTFNRAISFKSPASPFTVCWARNRLTPTIALSVKSIILALSQT